MLFVVVKKDKPGHAHVRAEVRPAHVEFLKANAGKVVMGGPLLDADGETMIGSLLVVEAASAAEAEAFLAQDPFAQAGLFASVEVMPWKWTFNPR